MNNCRNYYNVIPYAFAYKNTKNIFSDFLLFD